jgi:hypothetical protein
MPASRAATDFWLEPMKTICLTREPERSQSRLQLRDAWASAVEAEAGCAAEPITDGVWVDRDLGLRGGQLDDEDARGAAGYRPAPRDGSLDGKVVGAQQVAAVEEWRWRMMG